MAYDWQKILMVFGVMRESSGYPNQKHIFDAAIKELEELAPVPEGMKHRGIYTEHGGSKEPKEGPMPAPAPGPLSPPPSSTPSSQPSANRRV